jgi:hypothetical protein
MKRKESWCKCHVFEGIEGLLWTARGRRIELALAGKREKSIDFWDGSWYINNPQ